MAFSVTNTFTNGTLADADEVNANFTDVENELNGITKTGVLFTVAGSDLTLGSNATQNEVEIAEVLIPANTVTTGVVIMASGYVSGFEANYNIGTIKLRTGTNASGPSNTLRATITRSLKGDGSSEHGKIGWSLSWVLTAEETWSGNVYVHITGQNSSATSPSIGCETLVVLGW